MTDYTVLEVEVAEHIAHVRLNRPEKANALSAPFWTEIPRAFRWIAGNPDVRVAVISGNGKHFCAGIDLEMLAAGAGRALADDPGRAREALRLRILELQDTFTAIERCRKPVLAAVHGSCLGAGVDLVSACDMRYCTADAAFAIREIDIGLTADVGTLQRLPRLIGDGILRELAYTGRPVLGPEAAQIGLVNRAFPDREALLQGVMQIARAIAAKAPLAVRGSKEMILYTRDHTVADSLNYIATWNAAMLSEADIREGVAAQREKRPPSFQG
jgi:enoyl-CoA hydratase